jgi:4a-hydroxytetrahydrobiopterin dehydratase
VDGIQQLGRVFMFRNFSQSMTFVKMVAKIAEEEQHHPSIFIDYDEVTLSWWTYKLRGLHLNDFIMAAKTDYLLRLYPLE